MRYLDGELTPAERERVERAASQSSEIQRELTLFKAMKADLQDLSFTPAVRDKSVWGTVNRRLTRPVGWIFLVIGVLAWSLYGAYVYTTSPVDPLEKLATGAVVIGILLLLASVISDRYHEWLTDPYKDVQR
jgi:anti-sigma factor RsiW